MVTKQHHAVNATPEKISDFITFALIVSAAAGSCGA